MDLNKNIVLQIEQALSHLKSTPHHPHPSQNSELKKKKKDKNKTNILNKAGNSGWVLTKGCG